MKKLIFWSMSALMLAAIVATYILVQVSDGRIPLHLLILFFVIFIPWLCSKVISKKISRPINEMHPDEFDEISEFVKAMKDERKKTEREIKTLRKNMNTFYMVTEIMKEGLILLDKHGDVFSYNPSAVLLLKSDFESFESKNIYEITRDITVLNNVKKALTGESCDCEVTVNERILHLFFNPTPFKGLTILIVDKTEAVMREKVRREFSANVSHELKTPLTVIHGYSELIETGLVRSEDVPEFARKIKSESNRLVKLIDNIIQISRLDDIKERKVECFSLLKQTNEVVERVLPIAEKKDVSIAVLGSDFLIKANQLLIDELLQNLIENAVKYNKTSGNVNIHLEIFEDNVEITVEDTGIGIPHEHTDRIFERFYRVDPSRNNKTGGTGLGLSIVKHVAMYHEGTVSICSEVGIGTKISVKFKSFE